MKATKIISTALFLIGFGLFTMANGGLKVNANKKDVTCFGDKNGSIELNVTGGNAPYSFLWSNGANTSSITNLSKGTYSVVITDASGLETAQHFVVSTPKTLTVMFNQHNLMPVNGMNAEINVAIMGGTTAENSSDYSISLNKVTNGQQINPSVDASYQLVVADANGCQLTLKPTVRIHENGETVEVKTINGFGEVDVFVSPVSLDQAQGKAPINTMN
jgi:hypothetical protein